MTAAIGTRIQRPFKAACRRNSEVARIAVRRLADQCAICAVAEVVEVADDVQAVAVVITSVHPVINIVPPALDVAILRKAVAIAVVHGRIGMILHRLDLAVVHLRAAGRAASSDALAVPVGKFDQEQHVHMPELCEVHLPEVAAKVVDAASCGASRDADLLGHIRSGFVVAAAVVAPDVQVVQLAKAVSAVAVDWANGEPIRRPICDLELQLLAGFRPLEVILRLLDLHAAAARPVPFHAVDRHKSCLYAYRGVGGRLVVAALHHLDRDHGCAGRVVHAFDRHNAGRLIDGLDRRDPIPYQEVWYSILPSYIRRAQERAPVLDPL